MLSKAARIGVFLAIVSAACMAAYVGRQPATVALFSDDQQEQRLALGVMRREHAENIQSLIKLVGQKEVDDSQDGVRHLAIRLLGDMRATEAIALLVERLTYLPNRAPYVLEELPREAYYPCAMALINIGDPSTSAVINSIEWKKDKTTREVAAWVLMQIKGKEEAAQCLQDLANKSHDGRLKPRLQEAHDFIVNYKPILSPPGVEPSPNLIQPKGDSQK